MTEPSFREIAQATANFEAALDAAIREHLKIRKHLSKRGRKYLRRIVTAVLAAPPGDASVLCDIIDMLAQDNELLLEMDLSKPLEPPTFRRYFTPPEG